MLVEFDTVCDGLPEFNLGNVHFKRWSCLFEQFLADYKSITLPVSAASA